MAVRLKDIAADLGVSTVTVSKVLRGGVDIGERTRARVCFRPCAVIPNSSTIRPCAAYWPGMISISRI